MTKLFSIIVLLLCSWSLQAQTTFKAGWNTYPVGSTTREYGYVASFADSLRLTPSDSAYTYASPDSSVTMTVCYPFHDRSIYKTIHYFNPKKQIIKIEEFKDDNQQSLSEWKYDDKNRKSYHLHENKLNGNVYKKTFNYAEDKKSGDFIITENAYYNGRIEFYTKSYYNKARVKYKEVRLNDNNKDVIHIETFTYGENGKVKERSVFFPEWKVTKKFPEYEGMMPVKCYKTLPPGIAEKPTLASRTSYMRKVMVKNRVMLQDSECSCFEYAFNYGPVCEMVVSPAKANKNMKVVFRYKEKR
jgi:hypothetical protein